VGHLVVFWEDSLEKESVNTALITGITGQDGSYLAELLLAKGYVVHGLIRRSSTFNTSRIEHLYKDPHDSSRKLILHYGDMTDGSRLASLISEIAPDEIYNLAAQSHVRVSFDEPVFTGDVTGLGTIKILEAIRQAKKNVKFYQASSSEMFGDAAAPQGLDTPFSPRSPYAAAKLYSHWVTKNYREAYDMFAVSGVLFNHESPRRGETFLTRKVSRAVARISAGLENELFLGNLEAKRDWGYAPDYVVAMWRMLQQDQPVDHVIGTGKSSSVSSFVETCFRHAGLNHLDYVKFDPRYLRPTEVADLQANNTESAKALGMNDLVGVELLSQIMVEEDIKKLQDPDHVDKPIGKLWRQETE